MCEERRESFSGGTERPSLYIGFCLSVSLYLLSLGWSVFFIALQSITCLSFMYASLKTKTVD